MKDDQPNERGEPKILLQIYILISEPSHQKVGLRHYKSSLAYNSATPSVIFGSSWI